MLQWDKCKVKETNNFITKTACLCLNLVAACLNSHNSREGFVYLVQQSTSLKEISNYSRLRWQHLQGELNHDPRNWQVKEAQVSVLLLRPSVQCDECHDQGLTTHSACRLPPLTLLKYPWGFLLLGILGFTPQYLFENCSTISGDKLKIFPAVISQIVYVNICQITYFYVVPYSYRGEYHVTNVVLTLPAA